MRSPPPESHAGCEDLAAKLGPGTEPIKIVNKPDPKGDQPPGKEKTESLVEQDFAGIEARNHGRDYHRGRECQNDGQATAAWDSAGMHFPHARRVQDAPPDS